MSKKNDKKAKKKKSLFMRITVSLFAIAILLGAGGFVFLKGGGLGNGYQVAYEKAYNEAHEKAEKAVHVKNRISISLGNTRETANLRVLEVTDVVYIIENESDNSDGITAWLEVPGNGFFTVDLQTSEFLVDEERQEVIVRIPEPKLSDFSIDYTSVNRLEFHNEGANDSIKVGEDLARKQCKEAYSELHSAFVSNPEYMKSAKNSAENILKNLIRQLNPEATELKVIIEYQ